MICKYIYQSMTHLFVFLMVSFEMQRFLILLKSVLPFFFSFMDCALGVMSKKSLPNPRSQRCFYSFSSNNKYYVEH